MPTNRFLSFIAISFLAFSLFSSCKCQAKYANKSTITPLEYSADTLKINLAVYYRGDSYLIDRKIDLKGKTLYLPPDITIQMKGGVFTNGIIDGNNTTLKYVSNKVVFDRVRIKGSWRVPNINTNMFATLNYDNSLKDVFALANPVINNRIYIRGGLYNLTAYKRNAQCIRIESNSDVVIDGTIVLSPNEFTNYRVISIEGNNIRLTGKGIVVGDKEKHLGKKGEWGMGVYISKGNNVYVSGLTIKDCWGDCIYISGNSRDVIVDGCFLNNGRRQGISITSAKNVLVKNCIISNVKGKAPQYAIDIEPNAGDKVIDNVKVIDCKGGFMCTGNAPNSYIGSVEIKNCTIENTELLPIYLDRGRSFSVEGCMINNAKTDHMITCCNVDTVNVINNSISCILLDTPPRRAIDVTNKAKFKRVNNNVIY